MTTEYNIAARELEEALNETDMWCTWRVEKEGLDFQERHGVRSFTEEEREAYKTSTGAYPPTEEEQMEVYRSNFYFRVESRKFYGARGLLLATTSVHREYLKKQYPDGVTYLINIIHEGMQKELDRIGETW